MTDMLRPLSPLAIIIMGSPSDMAHAKLIKNALECFTISVEMRIGSAHKTAAHVMAMLERYEALPNPKIYITIAGRSNALSGFVDGYVRSPTIACPPPSENFGGSDIYSSLRMPSGICPAVILEPKNAALFAARIFALYDKHIYDLVQSHMKENEKAIIDADQQLYQ